MTKAREALDWLALCYSDDWTWRWQSMRARCHPRAPAFLWRRGDRYALTCIHPGCATVPLLTVRAQLELTHDDSRFDLHRDGSSLFSQGCHPRSAVWASYRYASGVVVLTCHACGHIAARLTLEG